MKRQLVYMLLFSMSVSAISWALLHSQALAGTEKSPAVTSDTNNVNKVADKAGKIVATVDGEPIYEKDILAGMPPATFAGIDKYTQDMKLQRLIDEAKLRHFLNANKIQVSAAEVDKEIDDYKKNPPGPRCPCCRYANLEQFLQANHYTLDEFRETVRLSKGMDAYFDGLWRQKYSEKDLVSKLVKDRQPEFEKKYFELFQIIFHIKDFNNQDEQRLGASKRANLAWARLEKGESFEKVAKEMSDDTVSGQKGGCLGPMPSNTAWPDMEKLPFGVCSKPIADSYGYTIIKKEKISTDDIIAILKEEFIQEKNDEIAAAIDANAVVRKQ
ncbi:MAG: peptidylprolyl isomerase [Sedimentisphaerales bacterium]